jgi:hypothetical protein
MDKWVPVAQQSGFIDRLRRAGRQVPQFLVEATDDVPLKSNVRYLGRDAVPESALGCRVAATMLAFALTSFRLPSLYSALHLTMVLTARAISSSCRPPRCAGLYRTGHGRVSARCAERSLLYRAPVALVDQRTHAHTQTGSFTPSKYPRQSRGILREPLKAAGRGR